MDRETSPRTVGVSAPGSTGSPSDAVGPAGLGVRLAPVVASPLLPQIELAPGDTKTVGRGTNADVVIDEPSLSRLHARLTLDRSGGLRVEDLGSLNGVTVNGARQSSASLQPGSVVRFGLVEYRVIGSQASSTIVAQMFGQTFGHTVVRVGVPKNAPPPVDKVLLEALLATSRELMGFADLPALLERVLDRVEAVLKPNRAAILLVDAATGAVTPRAVRPRGAYTSVSEFASSTVIREALSSRDALIIYDPMLDPQLQHAQSVVGSHLHSAICVPLLGRAGAIGALYVDRVGTAQVFTPELAQYAAAFASSAGVALETAQLYDDRERHFRATLEAFARAIDARDPYTAGHSERVARCVVTLARAGGLPDAEIETLRRGSMLHDIGKVGVPDAVLRKPGPLDADERAAIEAHPAIGYYMLESVPFLAEALPAVRSHHERWDGQGYPDRLAGTDIHPHARLLAVADTYDAMTSARPYRTALSRDEAVRRIRAERGRQFEPAAIDIFDAVEPELHAVRAEAQATV